MTSKNIGALIKEVQEKRLFLIGQMLEGSRRGDISDIPNLRLKVESLRRFEGRLTKRQVRGQKTVTIQSANKMLEAIYGKMHVNPWQRR